MSSTRSTAWCKRTPLRRNVVVLRKAFAAILAILTLAYPLAIYLAVDRFAPAWLALVLIALALARAVLTRQSLWLGAAAAAAILGVLGGVRGELLPLQIYPVLVNTALFGIFFASLLRPPTVIERLARLSEPELPPAAVRYTRQVTVVWCTFFVVNAVCSLATALWASLEVWTFYNGFLSYVLIGLLFGVEWLIRKRVRARIASQSEVEVRHARVA